MTEPTTIVRAYRSELDPTTAQRKAMSRQAGAARWAYNWGLARWKEQYAEHKAGTREKPPSWMSLHKELTQVKRLPDTLWLADASSYVIREALADLGDAYKHFFRRIKEGVRGPEAGEPTFRKRSEPSGRGFRIAQPQAIDVLVNPEGKSWMVKIAGIGGVKLRRHGYIPAGANYRGLSVREIAGRWYVAIQVEEVATLPMPTLDRAGVELGVRILAVTGVGQKHAAIRDLANLPKEKRRLALWSRRMARRHVKSKKAKEQSKGWKACVRRVQQIHDRIASMRKDAQHQATTRIVRRANSGVLVMRNVQVKRMIGRAGKTGEDARKRNRLAPMIAEVGMYEMRRQIEYKQRWAGGTVVITPTEYPSTKRCSRCGAVRDTEPSYPTFVCPSCGAHVDREENSAENLRAFDPENTPGSGPAGGLSVGKRSRKRSQRPSEPGSQTAQNTASDGPDSDETSALGTGNRAEGEKSSAETGAMEVSTSSATQPEGRNPPATSPLQHRSSAEVLHQPDPRKSTHLRADDDGVVGAARKAVASDAE